MGRFTQRLAWRDLVALMRLEGPPSPFRPRYNLAPSQDAAVLRREHGEPRLAMLRWGLVSGWTRDPAIGSRLINARAETAAFRSAWTARRCLVPADGFYEWRRGEPWLFAPRDGAVMALAGLWERWRAPAGLDPDEPGPEPATFTILTTEANATVRLSIPALVPRNLDRLPHYSIASSGRERTIFIVSKLTVTTRRNRSSG